MKILPCYLAVVVLSFASPVMAERLTDATALPSEVIDLAPPTDNTIEILGFERRRFTVRRVRGKVLINDVVAPRDVVENTTQEIRLIEYFDNLNFSSSSDFRRWVKKLRGSRTFTYDVVFLRDAQLQEQTTPLVLLPNEQRANAEVAWRQWLENQRTAAEQTRLAQQKAEREEQEYTALKRSTILTSRSEVSSVDLFSDRWRVYLSPDSQYPQGVLYSGLVSGFQASGIQFSGGTVLRQPASLTSVVIDANNSLLASQSVHAQYPNHRIVGIQRVRTRPY